MLSANDKERLKNMLPRDYGITITKELKKRNVTQHNGKPFQNQYVKLWFKDKMKNRILDKAVQRIVKDLTENPTA